jgi:LacI family transcriptional regulator
MFMSAIPTKPCARITLKDIAARCGVSVGTVSFVLRGDPRFSPETVARVCAVAEEMGYDPANNHAARRLVMMGRGQKVINHLAGVLLPAHFTQANYFSQLFQGLSEALTRERYGMLMLPLFSWEEAPESLPYLPPSLTRGDVDGVIAFESPYGIAILLEKLRAYCDLDTFPLVFLLHEIPGYACVLADDEGGGYAAAAHLLALGHRHLLFLPEIAAKSEMMVRRRQGMQRAFREYGLNPAEGLHNLDITFGSSNPPHHLDLSNQQADVHPLVVYLRAHPEITGICARNDAAARRITCLCSQVGWQVPADYSLVGFDDVDPLPDDAGRNQLTSVRVPLEQIGQAAVGLLTRQIAADTRSAEQITLPTELIIRDTTAAPRA